MKSKEQISVTVSILIRPIYTIKEQFKRHGVNQNKYDDGKWLGSFNEVENLLNEDK